MVFEAIVAILVPISVLIIGLALLVFSSDRAVKHSMHACLHKNGE